MVRRARPARSRRRPAEPARRRERRPPRRTPAAAAPVAPLWRWLSRSPRVLVTLAVFWPVLGHQFLDWDDDLNFVNNPEFRGLGWTNLRFMLDHDADGALVAATWITFGVDYVLWGMNPRGYHLTSLLLHAATAVAVLLRWRSGCCARRMAGASRPSAGARWPPRSCSRSTRCASSRSRG